MTDRDQIRFALKFSVANSRLEWPVFVCMYCTANHQIPVTCDRICMHSIDLDKKII